MTHKQNRAALAYRMWPDQPEAAAVDRLRRMLHELRVELKMRGLGEALPIYAERQWLGLEADGALKIDTASFRDACEDLELLGDAGVCAIGGSMRRSSSSATAISESGRRSHRSGRSRTRNGAGTTS